jgi:NAD(P)-dependent dehydrogenase (short-subunit alcohol dehydrogenase family)
MQAQDIVIVGGTSGIGLETALQLSRRGHRVTVAGRDASRVSKARELGLAAEPFDAADEAAADRFFVGRRVDHLVLCPSGSAGAGLFRELPLADLRRGFEGKFWPQLTCLKAALPSLSAQASVTLLTAISSRAMQPGTAGLAAINMALEAMVPVLASELRPLRVNAVAPGVVDTPWWDRVAPAERQALFERMGAAVPAGRVGRPADIAQAILLLVENSFMTGCVIDCDGGWKLKPA